MLTCQKCNVPFVSTTYMGNMPVCKTCRYNPNTKVTPVNPPCSLCNETYPISRVVSTIYDKTRCNSCQGKYKKACKCCKSDFISYFHLQNCDECEGIKIDLYRFSVHGIDINPADYSMYSNKIVDVKYIVNQQTHNGYCATSGPAMDSIFEMVKTFPLLRFIDEGDILPSGEIKLTSRVLSYYQRDAIPHSAYCNAKTTFLIDSARVY
jgi:hypothetical protein